MNTHDTHTDYQTTNKKRARHDNTQNRKRIRKEKRKKLDAKSDSDQRGRHNVEEDVGIVTPHKMSTKALKRDNKVKEVALREQTGGGEQWD